MRTCCSSERFQRERGSTRTSVKDMAFRKHAESMRPPSTARGQPFTMLGFPLLMASSFPAQRKPSFQRDSFSRDMLSFPHFLKLLFPSCLCGFHSVYIKAFSSLRYLSGNNMFRTQWPARKQEHSGITLPTSCPSIRFLREMSSVFLYGPNNLLTERTIQYV